MAMELHLGNVPEYLSQNDLREELGPFMDHLNITGWDCWKPRDKRFGFVSFLKEPDGSLFLEVHGKQPHPNSTKNGTWLSVRPRELANLVFLNTPIYVSKSHGRAARPAIVQPHHQEEEHDHHSHPEPKEPSSPLACRSTHISCGHNMFVNEDNLAFIEQTRYSVLSTVKFGRRFLVVAFNSGVRMNIHHDSIESWIMSAEDSTLTLVLREPPRCYEKVDSPLQLYSSPKTEPKLKRLPFVTNWPNHDKYVAYCRVYQLKLLSEDYEDIRQLLLQMETVSVTETGLDVITLPRVSQDYITANRAFEQEMDILEMSENSLPFAFRFQVQALVWNNYLHPTAGLDLLMMLKGVVVEAKSQKMASPVTVESIKDLFENIPYACPGAQAIEVDVQELMRRTISLEAELSQGPDSQDRDPIYGASVTSNQVFVFKAMVTPTSIILRGPEPESKNRVLRMFEKYSDHFLRVTFGDEDGENIQFNLNVSNEAVYDRYRTVLRNGIRIAGRGFSFLGFSHSSLRSHSVWFAAPFRDGNNVLQSQTAILKGLGDFSQIRIPAKCAARIGQAFSETPYAASLRECGIQVEYIPDIVSSDNSRVFSDGVGTISPDAVEALGPYLPPRWKTATCFQIRLGGIKGMLSLDPRIRGKVIRIRGSMNKFPSPNMDELGICDMASRPLPLYLNRQVIKIMEDMGTKNEWFLEQLRIAKGVLKEALTKPAKTSSFLKLQRIGINMSFPWLIEHLSKLGINFRSDKFLRSIVEHAILRELRLLKYKARIFVTQGVTLFGVMDEFGFLEEGEIYVAYDKKHVLFSDRRCISIRDSTVLITRSPALHPGDVRLVQHRTPPAGHPLLELQNCVVFSQKGERDLPSQLSGGDLDGDLYNVLWDLDALPQKQFPPADYPRVNPKTLDRDVTQHDIAEFFVNFMKNDNLGLIATRHKIMADFQVEGTQNSTCISLAGLHSAAVDYSKTGQPVALEEIPKGPKTRPDFLAPIAPSKLHDVDQTQNPLDVASDDDDGDESGLGGAKYKYHRSDKILGHLFRNVDEKKIWNDAMGDRSEIRAHRIWPQVMEIVGARIKELGLNLHYSRKLREAQKIRHLYEKAIQDKMWKFSENPNKVLSEQEVFCGSIFSKKSSQTKRQREASIKLGKEMDEISTWVVKLILEPSAPIDAAPPSPFEGDEWIETRRREDVIELAWACLVAAESAEKQRPNSRRRRDEVQSFSTVAACCLLKELDGVTKPTKTKGDGGGGVRVGASQGNVSVISTQFANYQLDD